MKKRTLNRVLSICLISVMTVSLAACGKKTSDDDNIVEQASSSSKDYVYSQEDLTVGDLTMENMYGLSAVGDIAYFTEQVYSEDGDTSFNVYGVDGEQNVVTNYSISVADNDSITIYSMAEDGSMYAIVSSYDESDIQVIEGEDDIDLNGGAVIEEDTSDDAIDMEEADEATTSDDSDVTEDTEAADEESEESVDEGTIDQYSESDEDIDDSEDSDEESDLEIDTDSISVETEDGAMELSEEDLMSIMGDEYGTGSETNYLVKYDNTGAEVFRTELKDTSATDESTEADSEETEEFEYYYIYSMVYSSTAGVVISDTNGVSVYSAEDGSFVRTIESDDDISGTTLYVLNDGRVCCLLYDEEGNQVIFNIDIEKGKLTGDGFVISDYDITLYPGYNYDFLASSSESVYGFNLDDSEMTQLLNFVDSDIDTYGAAALCGISDTQMVAILTDTEGNSYISLLTKVQPEDVTDKQVITLGCNYIDYDVRAQVVAFNKESDKYRVKIVDYSDYDTEENDYTGGATKLSTDIVSGNTPDILVLDANMPVDSYNSKGLFEDLTSYFNSDEEISSTDYLDGVMSLCVDDDNKMYQIIPSFTVETVVGATADVGDGSSNWTLDDLKALVEAKGVEYKNIFGPYSREEIFQAALDLSGTSFIDWGTQTCNYNSEDFISLLDFVNEFPEELEEDDYYNDSSSYWRDGTSLLQIMYFSAFDEYNTMKKGTYGQDISLVGFPSSNGSGEVIYPSMQIAMSSTSENKEGCWEFMRRFLTNDFQKSVDGYFPVSVSVLEELGEQAKKKSTYTDENGNEVEYDETYTIGDTEIIVDPMTDEEVQTVIDYLNNLSSIGNYSDSIYNIVTEEAAAYFEGQKTAQEVADIIQSRVQIYVNENS